VKRMMEAACLLMTERLGIGGARLIAIEKCKVLELDKRLNLLPVLYLVLDLDKENQGNETIQETIKSLESKIEDIRGEQKTLLDRQSKNQELECLEALKKVLIKKSNINRLAKGGKR